MALHPGVVLGTLLVFLALAPVAPAHLVLPAAALLPGAVGYPCNCNGTASVFAVELAAAQPPGMLAVFVTVLFVNLFV